MTDALSRLVSSGRRSVGEPHFSVVLAFFNLAAALVLLAGVSFASLCILVNPEAGAARFVADGIKVALKLLSAVALGLTATQLIPGPAGWRTIRQHLGIANLLAVWPLVCVFAVITYAQLPDDVKDCG